MAHKPQIVTVDSSQKRFANPWPSLYSLCLEKCCNKYLLTDKQLRTVLPPPLPHIYVMCTWPIMRHLANKAESEDSPLETSLSRSGEPAGTRASRVIASSAPWSHFTHKFYAVRRQFYQIQFIAYNATTKFLIGSELRGRGMAGTEAVIQ